jgi:superfamily II DNA or RNA helicase
MDLPQGLYELLMDREVAEAVAALDQSLVAVDTEELDVGDSHTILARHLYALLLQRLRSFPVNQRPEKQVALYNAIVRLLGDDVHDVSELPEAQQLRQLLAILQRPMPGACVASGRPDTPLSSGSLLTGAPQDPTLLSQLRHEILSADQVDILCSFIRWTGIRTIEDALREFASREGSKLRFITTSYMGATDARAVEFLSELPHTEIRVSYDTRHTRLHAKSYLFHRDTGFSVAYVGSANLSRAALTEGLEWNVKISQREQPYLWEKIAATFETYWHDYQFEPYSGADVTRLREALGRERVGDDDSVSVFFDIEPYPFQLEILDKLTAERQLTGRSRHLVVAATGTGKTVVAAFDFRNWRNFVRKNDTHAQPRLLFIAHREEILRQSLATFRAVLRDANFGDLMVGGREPLSCDHLFLSIQTFNSRDMAALISPDYYDYVVVDEFHHAAAPSYQRLLDAIRPQVLLGLTATPERTDSLDVLAHFGNHISAELRLPDAINRTLLSPFQYFCVTDNVDLGGLRWQRGGYAIQDLEGLYTGNDARAALVIEKVHQYLLDPSAARGLGFCVSVAHAQYMARTFSEAGLKAECLTGESPDELRRDAQRRLRDREINFIFTVDLYNEGVDIPEIDTVLFLRPTESLTVFLQQLGRGLRHAEGKECLTVLDFVGQAHRNYRFDLKFRALLPGRHHNIEREVEQQFPHLPAGCTLQMERVAAQHVLENIRQAIRVANRPQLVQRIASFEEETGTDLTLGSFISHHGLELDDILRRASWSRLCADAGVREDFSEPDEEDICKGLRRLAHIDDMDWISTLRAVVCVGADEMTEYLADEIVQRQVLMAHFSLWGREAQIGSLIDSVERLQANPMMLSDLLGLLDLRQEMLSLVTSPADLPFLCPLRLHATYTRDELLAALGHWTIERQPEMREGVLYLRELPADLFLITLNKTAREYSPTTMYEDYAISEHLFHWQSQSTTSPESVTGQRYINHRESGHTPLLAVREDRRQRGLSCPFHFLGPADYVSHRGARPMSITWRLRHPMPAHLLRLTERLAVG